MLKDSMPRVFKLSEARVMSEKKSFMSSLETYGNGSENDRFGNRREFGVFPRIDELFKRFIR